MLLYASDKCNLREALWCFVESMEPSPWSSTSSKTRSASSGPSGNSCGPYSSRERSEPIEYWGSTIRMPRWAKQNQAKAPRVPAHRRKRPNVPSVVHILNCNKKQLAINHRDSDGTPKRIELCLGYCISKFKYIHVLTWSKYCAFYHKLCTTKSKKQINKYTHTLKNHVHIRIQVGKANDA